ncbi:archease [Kitasatospora sp. NPDC051914]|uniref:archease n=1 Tax=Kitasatospora sp. NPDC051914 TaxID=3154945 RepID=UPI00343A655F
MSGAPGAAPGGTGHRTVPHTGDLAVEAWAPEREECVAEAVRGAVGGFAEIPPGAVRTEREYELADDTDERLLVSALEEVIFRAETAGELPARVSVRRTGAGVRMRLAVVDSALVEQVGAVPKAVSLHGLRMTREAAGGWRCHVTLDV